jgi:hypothetical protein
MSPCADPQARARPYARPLAQVYHSAMRNIAALKARFPKIARALASALAIGALGAIGSYAQSALAADSCCALGMPCCHPGAPCCAGHHHAPTT